MGDAIGRWIVKFDNEKQLWHAKNYDEDENLYSDDRTLLERVIRLLGA